MSSIPLFPKELSWLSFNHRVLQEAKDPSVPPIERMRFLGIFSNNLDEFYRVHVADVRHRVLLAQTTEERAPDIQLLQKIQARVLELQAEFESTRHEVVKALAQSHVVFVDEQQLANKDIAWLRQHFQDHILRHLVPILITEATDLVRCVNEDSPYLCIEIQQGEQLQYAMIEVPTKEHQRFLQLPAEQSKRKKKVILLEHVISLCLPQLFAGIVEFDAVNAWSLKLTRNADFHINEEIDQSILEQMEEGLKQRIQAEPVRFAYDQHMPDAMVQFLMRKLRLTNYDSIVPSGPYRNFRDFIKFPNVGRKSLANKPILPIEHAQFTHSPSVFAAIRQSDILLYYPYHRFSHFTEFVRQAAYDPAVTHIRITVYRVAAQSRILSSLMDAVLNGKHVTVVVELRARFDEEANIEWSRMLTDAGIHVSFGIPNLKVHTKLCLVHRKEGDGITKYAALGTGNFHEHTAQIYTDFKLFTCQSAITDEVEQIFDFIRYSYRQYRFQHLLVSPLNIRRRLTQFIQTEMNNAAAGKPSWIQIKVNNLVDPQIIEQFYQASQAGVKVRLIVRGMCALQAGIKGVSENIKVISIVDRFLEHPRVFAFANAGEPLVYLGSADLMARNLDLRVEAMTPIYNPTQKQLVLRIFELQWRDNTKARLIDTEQKNSYVKRGNKRKVQAQMAIYDELVGFNQKRVNS